MSSPTDLTATVSSGAGVVVSANVVAVVVVEGSTVVDVVVVSAAVEAHADAMIAIAAKPTAAARWLGRVVTAADVKRVTSSLAALASNTYYVLRNTASEASYRATYTPADFTPR